MLVGLSLTLIVIACHQKASTRNIISNGVRIDYTDSKAGDTTLLFVHGWCLNKSYFADQVNYFRGRYRVITIDLPGYGKSGRNRTVWTTAAFGEDIKNVIDQLRLRNVVLIGHSMAGDIIVQGAINSGSKVIALVGIDNFKQAGVAAKGDSTQARKDYADAITAMRKNFKAVTIPYFEQSLFARSTSLAVRKRVLGDVLEVDTVIAADCMAQDDFDEGKKLLEANKKLYLINSNYTPTDTSGLAGHHIPFKLYPIRNTGHFPMIESPKEFNRLLAMALCNIANR